MLYLLGDVEPALHTSHMRPKGVQDVLCEAPTHPMSDASMRLMEPQVKIGVERKSEAGRVCVVRIIFDS